MTVPSDIQNPMTAHHEGDVRLLALLSEASSVLAVSLDQDAMLERMAALLVPALADWCFIDIGRESPRRVAVAHADPSMSAVADALRRYPLAPSHPAMSAMESGQAIVFPDVSDEVLQRAATDDHHLELLRALNLRSAASAPLIIEGRASGVISVLVTSPGRELSEGSRPFIELIAGRVALALENARLFRDVREAEDRYRSLVQKLDAIVWEMETDPPRVTFVSDRATTMLGYPPERWLDDGSFWESIIHPDDRARVSEYWRTETAHGHDHEMEYRVIAANGEVLWIRDMVQVDADQGVAPRKVRGLMTDITQRKREELYERTQSAVDHVFAKARSTEDIPPALLRALCETTGWELAGLWTVDEDDDVLRCHEMYVAPGVHVPDFVNLSRRLALPKGIGLAGRVWSEMAPTWIEDLSEDANFPRAPIAAREGLRGAMAFPVIAAGRLLGVVDLFTRHPHAVDSDLLALMETIGAQTGQFMERKRVESALRESEARTRAILEAAQDAVVSVDHTGTIFEFNPAAEQLFGYTRDDAIGGRLDELIVPPEYREAHRAGFRRYLATNEPKIIGHRVELPASRADGSEFPAEITISRVGISGPPLFTAFIRDISERIVAERRRDAQHEVVRALAEAEALDDAAPRFLEAMCRSLGWDVGTLWIVDEVDEVLRLGAVWTDPGIDAQEFIELSEGTTFRRGDTLPGRAWASRAPEWVPDTAADERLIRVAAIRQAGLHAAFAFPVTAGRDIMGVLEFFSREIREPEGEILQMLGSVGGQIGQFIVRKSIEERIRYQNTLLESQSEATLDGIIITSPSGRIAGFNRRAAEVFNFPPDLQDDVDSERIGQWILGQVEDPDAFLRRMVELHRDPTAEEREELALADGRVLDRYSAPLVGERGERYGRAWYYRDITESKRAERALAESRERFAFLAEASTVLSASLDESQTLETLARLVVPQLADACAIDVVDEDGILHPAAMEHTGDFPPEQPRRSYHVNPSGPHGPPYVLRTGRSEIATELPDEWIVEQAAGDAEWEQAVRALGVRSYICVPLTARGRTLGTMTLISTTSGRRFTATDLALAEDLARRAALACDNARLYADREHVARTLQDSLLPPTLPEISGVEIGAVYHFAGHGREVGGDFYDLFETGDDEWAIVIGDVCGKGADAAALTALSRYTIRAGAIQARKPSRVLSMLNEAILRQHAEGRFCTVSYVRLGAETEQHRRITVACGGHPLPLILRADGSISAFGRPGMLLGLFPDPTLTDHADELHPGDALILFTDGVIEARNEAGLLGDQGLRDIVESCAGSDASSIAQRIGRASLDLQGGEPHDDIAVVVIRMRPDNA